MRVKAITVGLMFMGFVAGVTTACSSAVSSNGDRERAIVVARDYPVLLAPNLKGGVAGWCLIGVTPDSSGCTVLSSTFTGPIFAENCEPQEHPIVSYIYALTTSEAAFVSIAGGTRVPTRAEAALPRSLRAVFVEIHGRLGGKAKRCPRLIAFTKSGHRIQGHARSRGPLQVELPERQTWNEAGYVPTGACTLKTEHVNGFVASRGAVLQNIKPVGGLFGNAFLSCVDTEYFEEKEDTYLDAAILLDAAHPGSPVAELPGMKPLAGHPGVFVAARDWRGRLVARRLHDAWLVVEEEKPLGLREPLRLLSHLRASVHIR